jgi:hypothetical protein
LAFRKAQSWAAVSALDPHVIAVGQCGPNTSRLTWSRLMTRRATCVVVLCSLSTLMATASWLQSSEPLSTPPNLLDRLEKRIRVLESQVEGLRKALQIQDHPLVEPNIPPSNEPTPPSTYAPRVPYQPGNRYTPPGTATPIPNLPPTNTPTPPTLQRMHLRIGRNWRSMGRRSTLCLRANCQMIRPSVGTFQS